MNDKEMQEAITLHAIYREKVIHEDGLINQRTTWFITLEALLFAAFGFIVKGFNANITDDTFLLVLIIFSALGISASITTHIGVQAALSAINGTNEKWEKLGYSASTVDKLPAIRGGGRKEDLFKKGAASSEFLPMIVGAGWVLILAVALYSRFSCA